MPSYEEALQELHDAQIELNSLESIEQAEAEARELVETIGEVRDALNAVADDAGKVKGDIEDVRGDLQEALDALGEAHGQMADYVGTASDAAGQVAEGVGQFGEAAETVAGELDRLHGHLTKVQELIDLADADPHEIIGEFNSYFQSLLDYLPSWVQLFPGFTAFMTIWVKAIESIRVSAMALEAEVLSRNRHGREAGLDFDVYVEIVTQREQRRRRIQELRDRIDELEDQVGEHPDNPAVQAAARQAAMDRTVQTDLHNARQLALKDAGLTLAEYEDLRGDLSWARWRVIQAWERLRFLEMELTLDPFARAAGALIARYWEADALGKNEEAAELARRIEQLETVSIPAAEAELEEALDAYHELRDRVDAVNAHQREIIEKYGKDETKRYVEEHLPWIADPDYWSTSDQALERATPETMRHRLETPWRAGAAIERISGAAPRDRDDHARTIGEGRPEGRRVSLPMAAGGLLVAAALVVTVVVAVGGDGPQVAVGAPGDQTSTSTGDLADAPSSDMDVTAGDEEGTSAGGESEPALPSAREQALAAYRATDFGMPDGRSDWITSRSQYPAVVRLGHLDIDATGVDELRHRTASAGAPSSLLAAAGRASVHPGIGPGPVRTRAAQLQDPGAPPDSPFGCGSTESFRVVCAGDDSGVDEGPQLLFSMRLTTPIPDPDPDGWTYVYALVVDSDGDAANNWVADPAFDWDLFQGSDRWYELHGTPSEAGRIDWSLTVTDASAGAARGNTTSSARAIVDGGRISFLVPADEFAVADPRYRMTAFAHDGTFDFMNMGADVSVGAPDASDWPLTDSAGRTVVEIVSPPTSPDSSPPSPDADAGSDPAQLSGQVAAFIEQFAAAIAAGDTRFLLDRLHPVVLQTADEAACRRFIEEEILGLSDYRLAGEVQGPARRTFDTPDGSVVVEQVLDAPIAFTFQGQAFEVNGSFAPAANEMRWFTTCD